MISGRFWRLAGIFVWVCMVIGMLPTVRAQETNPTTPTVNHKVFIPLVRSYRAPVPQPPANGGVFINRSIKLTSAASAIDANGGMHAAFVQSAPLADNPPAIYSYCPPPAQQCEDLNKWQSVALDAKVSEVQLKLTPAGQPRLLYIRDSTHTNGGRDYYYAECNANCTVKASWKTTFVRDSFGTSSFDVFDYVLPQHTFALDHSGRPRFVFNDRNFLIEPDHYSAYYVWCDANCTVSANWKETRIGRWIVGTGFYEFFNYPSLTFTSANQPRLLTSMFAMNEDGTDDRQGLYYLSCNANCDVRSNWQRAWIMDQGLGSNPSPIWDLELDANDNPRVALFTGDGLPNKDDEHQLAYLWCNSDCAKDDTNWFGTWLNIGTNRGVSPDLELDAAGHPRIAWVDDLHDIGYSWCNTACESANSVWDDKIVETTSVLKQQFPQAIPPTCDQDLWLTRSPDLSLDPVGNPRIAYDVPIKARCTTSGGTTFSTIWETVRWTFFVQPQ